jgi:hypothetical protein
MTTPVELRSASRVWAEYSFWWLVFGVVSGAISLISIVQRAYSVGLTSLWWDLIDAYRRLVYPAFDFMFQVVPFHLPAWYKDAVVVSSVFGALLMRSYMAAGPPLEEMMGKGWKIAIRAWSIFGSVFLAITLLGLVVPLLELRYLRQPSHDPDHIGPDKLRIIEEIIESTTRTSERDRQKARSAVEGLRLIDAAGGMGQIRHEGAWLLLVSALAMLSALVMFLLLNAGL